MNFRLVFEPQSWKEYDGNFIKKGKRPSWAISLPPFFRPKQPISCSLLTGAQRGILSSTCHSSFPNPINFTAQVIGIHKFEFNILVFKTCLNFDGFWWNGNRYTTSDRMVNLVNSSNSLKDHIQLTSKKKGPYPRCWNFVKLWILYKLPPDLNKSKPDVVRILHYASTKHSIFFMSLWARS